MSQSQSLSLTAAELVCLSRLFALRMSALEEVELYPLLNRSRLFWTAFTGLKVHNRHLHILELN